MCDRVLGIRAARLEGLRLEPAARGPRRREATRVRQVGALSSVTGELLEAAAGELLEAAASEARPPPLPMARSGSGSCSVFTSSPGPPPRTRAGLR